jgi:hypothetical protein
MKALLYLDEMTLENPALSRSRCLIAAEIVDFPVCEKEDLGNRQARCHRVFHIAGNNGYRNFH